MKNSLLDIKNKITGFVTEHGVVVMLIIGGCCSLVGTIFSPRHWYIWILLIPVWGYCAFFLLYTLLFSLYPLAFLVQAITKKRNDCKSIVQWMAYKIIFVLLLAIIVLVLYNTIFNGDDIKKTMEQLDPYPYYEDYDDDFRFGRPGH